MAAKQPMQRNNSRGANRKRSPGRKIVARAGARINRSAMKGSKATGEAANRLLSHRANGANGRNGAPSKSVPPLTFQQSRIALEQANQRYVDLFDFAPIGYVTFDRVGRIEEINFEAIRLLDRSRRQLVGLTFAICVAAENVDRFLVHLSKCRSSKGPVLTELRLRRMNGETFPVLLSSTATSALMKDGARLYQTAIIDLTQRKRSEQALREKEAELELIVTQTPFMLTRCSRDLRYRYVSRAYAKMVGQRPEQLAGKSIAEILGPEGMAAIRPYIERVLSGETVSYEMLVPFKEAGAHYLSAAYVPDKNERGEIVGWFASMSDISERKRAEEKIAEAARQQASLYRLAQSWQNAKSLDDVYAAALDAITSALHTDRASILLYDGEQVMRFVAWRGLSAKYRKAVEGHSPWKPGTKNPQPVCISDVNHAELPKSLKAVIRAEEIRGAAFIPLVIEGKLAGKFMMYHRVPHLFTDAELDLAMTIARQLAQAIEHEKDQEALRERERELARELQDQKQLQKISSQLITQQKIETIYTQIVEATATLLRSDCCSMQMVLPKTGELLLLAQKGFVPGSANGWQRITRKGGTSCAEAFRRGERVIVPDLQRCRFVKENDLILYRKSGIRSVQSTPLFSRAGELVGMISTHWRNVHEPSKRELRLLDVLARQAADLIESKRADDEVRESEARMRATVEQATAGVARSDVDGRIIFANQKLCEMLGYTESELIGKTIGDVTHPDDSKENIGLFRQLIRDGKPFEMEKRYVRKDGSILWGHVSVSPVRDATGKITSAVAVAVDVTARKEAEAELQRSNELLERRVRERTRELRKTNAQLESEIQRRKGLEGEILSVSDREQQRLGQELHDGLCQHLTAVAFMTRSIALRLRDHRVIDAADIEKVAELVNTAAVDTRNLSRALHRVDVDAAGLIVALQDLVDREIWRTPCRLEVKPSFQINDDAAAAHLYRIAREAVINANKHAKARQIVVRLERVRKEMMLRVIDDGVGFPKDLNPQQGLGFHIMNYRAQLIGGRLEIDSPQTGGTRVSCYWPVDGPRSRKSPNGDQSAAGMRKYSNSRVFPSDSTLQHLAPQGAANA